MMEEKYREVKTFIKKHKYEILLGTGLVITGAALVYCKKDITSVAEIAMNSLKREERRIEFEIKELYESIARLNETAPINKFHKIPRRLARIEELEVDLMNVRNEIRKVESK